MRKLVLVSSGRPLVIRAPDVLSAWSRNRESIYRGLEIATANALAAGYDQVYLLSHDDQGYAATYRSQLAKNVRVLFKPRGMPSSIHRIVGPLIFRRHIKDASVCRTSGLRSSLTAIVTKLLYGTRVILRQGYQVSRLTREVLSKTGSRRPFRAHVFLVLATLLELVANHVANAITVSSSAGRDYVTRRYVVDSRKVFVLPNWVDVTIFKPLPYITKERGRVIFVGKLELIKNIFSLVEAVKGISGARLYVAGDGPLAPLLKEKLRKEAIRNVVLMGMVPHHKLPDELNRSEVFVLPSFYEEIPKALLEGMACGLPVVGANVTGIREVIETGSTGLLCETTPDSIRCAIAQLLADASLRTRLGSSARRQMENDYNIGDVVRREIAIHYAVMKQ